LNARAKLTAERDVGPLKVVLSAMSERTRAMLEYHFDRDADEVFAVADVGDAPDAIIVDYDHPGTRAAIESGKWASGPPLIALAHGEVEAASAVLVSKPIEPAALAAAAAWLRDPGSRPAETREEPSSTARAVPAPVAEPTPATDPVAERSRRLPLAARDLDDVAPTASAASRRRPVEPDASALDDGSSDLRRRARVEALCGPARALAAFDDPNDPAHRHDPARHLDGHLARALDALQAKGSELRGVTLVMPDIEVYVLPWLDRVCTSEPLNWSAAVERVFREHDDDEVDLVTYDIRTVNTLVGRVNANACQSYPLGAFRWLAALFSARGRLPFGVDVRRPVQLRHWPAFTRLEMTPGCLAIAAEWTRAPRTIGSMVEHLGCEPRHVTAFHAGARAAGLLESRPE